MKSSHYSLYSYSFKVKLSCSKLNPSLIVGAKYFGQLSKAWTLFCEIVKEVKKKDLNIAGFWLKITPGILGRFSSIACLQCKLHHLLKE